MFTLFLEMFMFPVRSTMNVVDKISKAAMMLVDDAKNTAISNILKSNSELKLTDEQLRKVADIIKSATNQGFQRGLTSFQNTVKKHFENPKA